MDVEVVEVGEPAPADLPPRPPHRWRWWPALVVAVSAAVAVAVLRTPGHPDATPMPKPAPMPTPSRPTSPASPTDFTLPVINTLCGDDCDRSTDDPTYIDLIKQHVSGARAVSGVTVFRKGRPLGAVVLTAQSGVTTVYALSEVANQLRMRPSWAAGTQTGTYSFIASTRPIAGQAAAFMKSQTLLSQSSSGDKVDQFVALICGSASGCSSAGGRSSGASVAFPGAVVREQVVRAGESRAGASRAGTSRAGAVFTVQQPNGRILVIGVLPAGTSTLIRTHGWALRTASAGSRLIVTATTGFAALTPMQQQWVAQVPVS